ncbi:hypothetical protein [Shewanella atlantica]|uniref:Uncharacterized protein n=1 Tax=Shewanella atlantica TaxID=271099 RepID=A0A3S0IFX8_9GAMM|nr:hypothetical protein [Shewanella atlantica]RTR34580.1 hypothetical protein EKG39_02660 [Shewanella atlantica]
MKYTLLNAVLSAVIILSISHASLAHSDIPAPKPQQMPAPSFECASLSPSNIDARYAVFSSQSQPGYEVSDREIRLIKSQNRVIYKKSPIAFEAWDRNGEYVRYFPQELRSITYRPSDLRSLNMSYDLEQLFHLVSPKLKSQLRPAESIERSCFTVNQYQGQQDGQEIELEWIASLSLPYRLTIGQGQQRTTYRLISANNINADEFNALTRDYNDLDFADVGDSESDPFIAKMITQGFIQHGNSGFYDSNGNQLSEGHGSHGH